MNQKMFSGSIHDSNGFLMWLIWFKVEAARNGCNLAALRFHAIFPFTPLSMFLDIDESYREEDLKIRP